MQIALMANPWAEDAAHIVDADSHSAWRAAVSQIQTGRYSAAVRLDGDHRFTPVQEFHGAKWPRSVVSADGFLVVRTGLNNAHLAEDQWACLADFPRCVRIYDGNIGCQIGGFVRRALYPLPRIVIDRTQTGGAK